MTVRDATTSSRHPSGDTRDCLLLGLGSRVGKRSTLPGAWTLLMGGLR